MIDGALKCCVVDDWPLSEFGSGRIQTGFYTRYKKKARYMPVDILYRQLWMIRQLSGPVYVSPDQIQRPGSEWVCINSEISQLSMYQSKNRPDYSKYKKYKVQSSMTSLGFRFAAGPTLTPPVRAAACLLPHLNSAIEVASSN